MSSGGYILKYCEPIILDDDKAIRLNADAFNGGEYRNISYVVVRYIKKEIDFAPKDLTVIINKKTILEILDNFLFNKENRYLFNKYAPTTNSISPTNIPEIFRDIPAIREYVSFVTDITKKKNLYPTSVNILLNSFIASCNKYEDPDIIYFVDGPGKVTSYGLKYASSLSLTLIKHVMPDKYRSILELMSNAIDAAGITPSKSIGTFGIGFLSCLNFLEEYDDCIVFILRKLRQINIIKISLNDDKRDYKISYTRHSTANNTQSASVLVIVKVDDLDVDKIKNYNIYLSNYRGLIYVKTESDFIIDSNNKLKKEKLTEINNTHTAAFINDLCNPNNKEYIKNYSIYIKLLHFADKYGNSVKCVYSNKYIAIYNELSDTSRLTGDLDTIKTLLIPTVSMKDSKTPNNTYKVEILYNPRPPSYFCILSRGVSLFILNNNTNYHFYLHLPDTVDVAFTRDDVTRKTLCDLDINTLFNYSDKNSKYHFYYVFEQSLRAYKKYTMYRDIVDDKIRTLRDIVESEKNKIICPLDNLKIIESIIKVNPFLKCTSHDVYTSNYFSKKTISLIEEFIGQQKDIKIPDRLYILYDRKAAILPEISTLGSNNKIYYLSNREDELKEDDIKKILIKASLNKNYIGDLFNDVVNDIIVCSVDNIENIAFIIKGIKKYYDAYPPSSKTKEKDLIISLPGEEHKKYLIELSSQLDFIYNDIKRISSIFYSKGYDKEVIVNEVRKYMYIYYYIHNDIISPTSILTAPINLINGERQEYYVNNKINILPSKMCQNKNDMVVEFHRLFLVYNEKDMHNWCPIDGRYYSIFCLPDIFKDNSTECDWRKKSILLKIMQTIYTYAEEEKVENNNNLFRIYGSRTPKSILVVLIYFLCGIIKITHNRVCGYYEIVKDLLSKPPTAENKSIYKNIYDNIRIYAINRSNQRPLHLIDSYKLEDSIHIRNIISNAITSSRGIENKTYLVNSNPIRKNKFMLQQFISYVYKKEFINFFDPDIRAENSKNNKKIIEIALNSTIIRDSSVLLLEMLQNAIDASPKEKNDPKVIDINLVVVDKSYISLKVKNKGGMSPDNIIAMLLPFYSTKKDNKTKDTIGQLGSGFFTLLTHSYETSVITKKGDGVYVITMKKTLEKDLFGSTMDDTVVEVDAELHDGDLKEADFTSVSINLNICDYNLIDSFIKNYISEIPNSVSIIYNGLKLNQTVTYENTKNISDVFKYRICKEKNIESYVFIGTIPCKPLSNVIRDIYGSNYYTEEYIKILNESVIINISPDKCKITQNRSNIILLEEDKTKFTHLLNSICSLITSDYINLYGKSDLNYIFRDHRYYKYGIKRSYILGIYEEYLRINSTKLNKLPDEMLKKEEKDVTLTQVTINIINGMIKLYLNQLYNFMKNGGLLTTIKPPESDKVFNEYINNINNEYIGIKYNKDYINKYFDEFINILKSDHYYNTSNHILFCILFRYNRYYSSIPSMELINALYKCKDQYKTDDMATQIDERFIKSEDFINFIIECIKIANRSELR